MKTYSAKPADITRVWYVLDASEAPLGRLSTRAASLLIGKGKPMVTPHIDSGDYVVVINADKLVVSGNKLQGKQYYRHSGFPGGLSQRSLGRQMELDSKKVVFDSVRGMLPVNKLRDGRLARLKIYPTDVHGHGPQSPTKLNLNESGK